MNSAERNKSWLHRDRDGLRRMNESSEGKEGRIHYILGMANMVWLTHWDCVHGGKEGLEIKFKHLHEVGQIMENELIFEVTQ